MVLNASKQQSSVRFSVLNKLISGSAPQVRKSGTLGSPVK